MEEKSKFTFKLTDAFYLLVLMWIVQLAQFLLPISSLFGHLGILPRTIEGLWQIPLAPWIHHGFAHLIANSLPFLILGSFIQFNSRNDFIFATVLITLLAGLGTWTFGDKAYHAGASSLVFGYWSYLIALAWYKRSVKSLLIAMLALFIYGGLFFALLKVDPKISWSGHAFGFLGGIIAASLKNAMSFNSKGKKA